MSGRSARGGREGFTLIETLVAMVIAAVILTALVPPLLYVAQQQHRVEGEMHRSMILAAEANRLAAMPFASLDTEDGCLTESTPPHPYERCIDVRHVSSRKREIVIKVTPLNSALRPDTVVIGRARARESNPF